jgi:hypothetical protein
MVISELMPGILGENNDFEFIELYNAGAEVVNLKGWSLWYKMTDAQEEKRVYLWATPTEVPGYGHYLLAREGEDIGVIPDGSFDLPLFEGRGGLVLRDGEGAVVDSLGWGAGEAPVDFVADIPAPAPEPGASLVRLPGGAEGNGQDTDNSTEDFVQRADPFPQNSGMTITPQPDERLTISATAPVTVSPGTRFPLTVVVENRTGQDLASLRVEVPLPEGVVVEALAPGDGASGEGIQRLPEDAPDVPDEVVAWIVPQLSAGETQTADLTLRSPWRYGLVTLKGYNVQAPDWPMRAFGPFAAVAIQGGSIPIGTARTLVGNVVTVEGTATMYTGGFYAGSTGTKFYLEDETGGIQAYCPDGQGVVSVRVGDRVRVTGQIEVYRDSLEIIPGVYPDHVEVLAKDAATPEPLPVSAHAATHDESILGRLIEVEGVITRLEELSYSYEADLMDDQGDTVLIYLEKDTGVNPEFVEVGDRYRVTGISEVYDGTWQLKPRRSEDFERVYPPELMLEVRAQNSVGPGGLVTYTLTAYNHTPVTLQQVRIVAGPPYRYADVVAMDGASDITATGELAWMIPQLSPDGGAKTVTYTVRVRPNVTQGSFEAYARVTAEDWPTPVETEPWLTFVGAGVPIWAIQGAGARSPLVRSTATTDGVVTGVFPELGGFWLQSRMPDDDPATSEGLFVELATLGGMMVELDPPLALGDYVKVTGRVRERSGQTLLDPEGPEDVEVVEAGYDLPQPVELDPPRDETEARSYYEALEGMLVSVEAPALAVAPTSQYGETALVRFSWGITRVMKGDPKGMLIFADDGSSASHMTRATMPYAAKTGDRVGDLMGPLAFTYENYKIQPIITPTVMTAPVTVPSLAPLERGEFSVATFNVENFFDIFDPHPSSPERPDLDAYRLKVEKAAATLVAMGAPTIVGFQEVENVGILEDLAAAEALSIYDYEPVLIEGFDSRGIDVGYLVRGDQANLEGASQHDAPEGLTSRPPLMITVTVQIERGEQTIHLINNHFTSMAGGELATEPRRLAQAAWNTVLVEELRAADPDAHVIVMGDLNSFYASPPIDALREAGLRHVYERVAPELPYTYIYQGESETLDHILVTPALYEQVVRVEALHTNADFPPPEPDDASPLRVSDHDPLVAVFALDD